MINLGELLKSIFGVGSGLKREKRLDFVAVSEQWDRISTRLEARLIIVEKELEKCISDRAKMEHRISELEAGRHMPVLPALPPVKIKHLTHTLRVLVADDEQIMRKCVRMLMQDEAAKRGIAVEFDRARDGAECLEQLAQGEFDVLMLDLKMPKVSGFEVIKEMKKTLNGRPLIFAITGYFRTYPEIEKLLADGTITMVLEKPVDKENIALVFDKIKELL